MTLFTRISAFTVEYPFFNFSNWKNKITPLEQISGLSWGATKNYVNGIPTGTDYSVTLYTKVNLIATTIFRKG